MNGPAVCWSDGPSRNTPQSPYTTLGIAASSSTMYETGTRIHGGASSTRKSAAPTPTIVPKISASSDVTSVPAMNGSAPNDSFGGFHFVDQMNPIPNLWIAGHAWRVSSYIIASTRAKTLSAAAVTSQWNRCSN